MDEDTQSRSPWLWAGVHPGRVSRLPPATFASRLSACCCALLVLTTFYLMRRRPIQAIESCMPLNSTELCSRRSGSCSWFEESSACEPSPLSIAEYLPAMCATHSFDELSCVQALEGNCYFDNGVCAMNQAAVDSNLAATCEDWVPGSDCMIMGDSCPSFRENPTRPTFGCCRSAIADSGQEICMTTNMMFDGHLDCLDQQDESPCMWAYKADLCQQTNVDTACFPDLVSNRGTNFRGNTGRNASLAGGGRGGGDGGNATAGGRGGTAGGRGQGRRMQGRGAPVEVTFSQTCSPQCDRALTAARTLGCLAQPELFGKSLRMITPEQWNSYTGVCNCQNHPERTRNNASQHMACCDAVTENLDAVERLQHDATDTCSAEEASSFATTLDTCQGERAYGNVSVIRIAL